MTWIVLARSGEISWVGQALVWVRRPLHYITLHFITQTHTVIVGWPLLYILNCSPLSGAYQGAYQGGYQNPGFVTRKELVKSGLLLGAGILKGALLTTVINNINNNNNGK